jgi:hypothetical protein
MVIFLAMLFTFWFFSLLFRSPVKINEDKENKLLTNEDLQLHVQSEIPKVESVPNNNCTVEDNVDQLETVNSDLKDNLKETQPSAFEIQNLNLPFAIGDLVWAYISGYPLWPSLITQDPLESVYTKTRSMSTFSVSFCQST